MVDLAGVEPASRILFFLLHTVLTSIYKNGTLAKMYHFYKQAEACVY